MRCGATGTVIMTAPTPLAEPADLMAAGASARDVRPLQQGIMGQTVVKGKTNEINAFTPSIT
jgi:hypothetical protein